MSKQKEPLTIDKLLESIDYYNGDSDIKLVIKKFVEKNLITATGLLIIWTHGAGVDIDGSRFSDTEAVWALEKAKFDILDKGISFND